jgi:SOS response regulatory protein OraA/RecX
VPVITALREQPRGRVEVQLDGRPWRALPADAVVRAGLLVGRPLDRETARSLARELRRSRALTDAVRVLRHRDVSRSRLDARLARRGARPEARADALAALEQVGLVDGERVARSRAQSLAGRGYGDTAIRFALEGEQLAPELVEEALAALEPERDRLQKLLPDPADRKALRRLAARGFAAETLEDIAGFANGG